MSGQINIDEEIACEILAEELKKAPKNINNAQALEDYCKKNISQRGKESMKFGFWASIFNVFKKPKAVAIIDSITPLQAEPQPQSSTVNNTMRTPLLVNVESSTT